MKTFRCHCGNMIFFENSQCLACGRPLGYLPDLSVMSTLEPVGNENWKALRAPERRDVYKMCKNYREQNVCNWMVSIEDGNHFCLCCRLDEIIPDLSEPGNKAYWHSIEAAKRRLLYTLHQLQLPIVSRQEDASNGLAFAFLADRSPSMEFYDNLSGHGRVLTGHQAGLITINIAEADDIARVTMRTRMGERYRTLLGHFRHEIGHYYWGRLIQHTPRYTHFLTLYGNEKQDYDIALQRYYNEGPPVDWQQNYISAYAAAHPWEDWAETWAHYLHMIDTLETAHDFGFVIKGREVSAPDIVVAADQGAQRASSASWSNFDDLVHDWVNLTIAINAVNRSMGLRDAYPFILTTNVKQKLLFVHQAITNTFSRTA